MAMDLANIYTETFQAHQRSIARSLHLEPGTNTNLAQLFNAQVIDRVLIGRLNNVDVNSRGALVVENIIARNDLDVYERFVAVWLSFNPNAANEFITNLNNVLGGWCMTRHQLAMAPPAPPPVAANLNPVDQQPPPANHGIPPAVANLDPAHYPALPIDPKGFTWSTQWQNAMNGRRVDFMNGFQFDAGMFDTLRQTDVITHGQHVSITAEYQPYNKAGITYAALEQRGPNTIRLFIAILRSNGNTRVLADEVQNAYDSAMRAAMN